MMDTRAETSISGLSPVTLPAHFYSLLPAEEQKGIKQKVFFRGREL